MKLFEAEQLLWWYFNVALPQTGISAVNMGSVSIELPGWQREDPNIALVSRARPIRAALRRCTARQQRILTLALTEQVWRYAPWRRAGSIGDEARKPNNERFQRLAELVQIYGERLAPLVWHYKPTGDVGRQRVWAECTLRAALVTFSRRYYD